MTRISPLVSISTKLPESIIDEVCLQLHDKHLEQSTVDQGNHNKYIRDTLGTGIPTYQWFAGMIWYYIDRVNREHFQYDITQIENENMNYLVYPAEGHYRWHQDNSLFVPDTTQSRKLSFSLLLSSPNDYTGGELQFHYNNYGSTGVFSAPKEKGSLIVFDSRLNHRVTPVKNGIRKVLVGWVTGPKWK